MVRTERSSCVQTLHDGKVCRLPGVPVGRLRYLVRRQHEGVGQVTHHGQLRWLDEHSDLGPALRKGLWRVMVGVWGAWLRELVRCPYQAMGLLCQKIKDARSSAAPQQ